MKKLSGHELLGRAMHMKGFEPKKYKHKKNWIAGAIKHPGALHKELGVKEGEKIPAKKLNAAAGKKGLIGKRARLAQTLKGFHHKHRKHHKGSLNQKPGMTGAFGKEPKGTSYEFEKSHHKGMCKAHHKMHCKSCHEKAHHKSK